MRKNQARRLASRLNGNAFIEYVHQLFFEWYGDNEKPVSFSKFPEFEYPKTDPRIF